MEFRKAYLFLNYIHNTIFYRDGNVNTDIIRRNAPYNDHDAYAVT